MPATRGHSLSSFVPAVVDNRYEVDVEEDESLPIPIPPLLCPFLLMNSYKEEVEMNMFKMIYQQLSFPLPPSPPPPFLRLLLNWSFNQIHLYCLSLHPNSLMMQRWNSIVVYECMLDFLWQTTTILLATLLLVLVFHLMQLVDSLFL